MPSPTQISDENTHTWNKTTAARVAATCLPGAWTAAAFHSRSTGEARVNTAPAGRAWVGSVIRTNTNYQCVVLINCRTYTTV